MKNTIPLNTLEVKFINKFNLTKDDIYADDIKRLEASERDWVQYDATTYINIKWYIEKKTLSVKLYPTRTTGNVWFYVNEKDTNWEWIQTQVSGKEFSELLSQRTFSMNEDL